MSEMQLYAISQQLRLLARRGCLTAADGRLLSGAVDPAIEALRDRLLLLLEALQDGRPLLPDAERILRACEQIAASHRTVIRQLQRDCA